MKHETIKPYSGEGAKQEQIRRMFDKIAPSYDRLNHALSLGIDRRWRRTAANALGKYKPRQILDIATGTGDFAVLLAKRIKPLHITGADISEGMMNIAREKVNRLGLGDVISFEKEDCLALSYADNTFDAVTAAFGIRNFQNLDKGLSEMCRVLKPGGALCIVELTTPVSFPMRQLFHIYSHTVLPLYGKMISKDSSAYSYLTATIEAFPQGEQMVEILRKAGFSEARFKRLTFGICTMYMAIK